MNEVKVFHGEDCLKQFKESLPSFFPILLDKPVLLKPNMLMNQPANSGITTDVRVVKILAEYLLDKGFKVIVGDGGDASLSSTMTSFANNGYVDMCKDLGIELYDFNKGNMVPKTIGGVQMFINKFALEYNVISIAKLKRHGTFKATFTLKNLMGCVMPKGHMHNNFTMKIEDVYNYINPVFGVVDGIVANGLCENIPSPLRMDTILASSNLPYLDMICSRIVGRSAEHIENLFKKSITCGEKICDYPIEELTKLYNEGGIK